MRLNAVAHVQAAVHAHLDTAPVVSGGSTDPSLNPSREPNLGRSEGEGETQVNTGPTHPFRFSMGEAPLSARATRGTKRARSPAIELDERPRQVVRHEAKRQVTGFALHDL